jgi:hypothetical protein
MRLSINKLRALEQLFRHGGLSIRSAVIAVAIVKRWLQWAEEPGSPPCPWL